MNTVKAPSADKTIALRKDRQAEAVNIRIFSRVGWNTGFCNWMDCLVNSPPVVRYKRKVVKQKRV